MTVLTCSPGAASRVGGASSAKSRAPLEQPGCCDALLKLLKLWSDDEQERRSSSSNPSANRRGAPHRYEAPPALAAPAASVAIRPTLLAEEASTELLLPKTEQQAELQDASNRDQHQAAVHDQGAVQGLPAGPQAAADAQHHACGPLGLGTPATPEAASAAAAVGARVGSTTTKAHPQHRRTPSGCEHHAAVMGILRSASRTSQHLAATGRHGKKPSLTRSELSKVMLAGGPVSASIAAVLASVCHHDWDRDDEYCSTCLEPYTTDNPKTMTSCGHHYHLPCLYAWMERGKSTCPWCQSTLAFEGM